MAKFKTISADWCDNFLENLNCAYDKGCGFNNMDPLLFNPFSLKIKVQILFLNFSCFFKY